MRVGVKGDSNYRVIIKYCALRVRGDRWILYSVPNLLDLVYRMVEYRPSQEGICKLRRCICLEALWGNHRTDIFNKEIGKLISYSRRSKSSSVLFMIINVKIGKKRQKTRNKEGKKKWEEKKGKIRNLINLLSFEWYLDDYVYDQNSVFLYDVVSLFLFEPQSLLIFLTSCFNVVWASYQCYCSLSY